MSAARSPLPLVRWLVDPERVEELLGDLEELRPRVGAARWWREAASICVRQSRLRAMPRSRFAAVAVLLAWAMIGAGLRTGGPRRIVRATDPAGAFTLAFQGSRIVAASLDGTPVPADRIHQSAGRLVIRGGDGPRDFAIHLLPNGAIYWHSRAARGPDHP